MDKIKIIGAREHNLKNISLEIPRDNLIVITGISGSGKSSLAFDTIFAEGQRRYVESLSSYARQFLGVMEKPDVDYIEGLSPSISIDQRSAGHNPRSTVGTVTEIYDYMRLLFARVGEPHCPKCGRKVTKQTATQINQKIRDLIQTHKGKMDSKKYISILSPVIKDKKGEHKNIFEEARRSGFSKIRVDGNMYSTVEKTLLDRNVKHTIEVVIDRIPLSVALSETNKERLFESVETALGLSDGVIIAVIDSKIKEEIFSEDFACPHCGISLPEIEPRTFSFNSPHGACPECQGLGAKKEIDPDLVVPNPRLTIAEGAIRPWTRGIGQGSWFMRVLEEVGRHHHFSIDVPFSELSREAKNIVLYGTEGETYYVSGYPTGYEGVIPNLERRYHQTESDHLRTEIERYMIEKICPRCLGKRLKPEALAVKIENKSIIDVCELTVDKEHKYFINLKLDATRAHIARQILKEIKERLGFLENVGLSYLTLARNASTLSGGEAQRIRLATQIGSSLMGVIYILDEPSIGLHQRDNKKLLATLKNLRDLGNTVIVVEHDRETIESADFIVDVGPGAGEHGGKVVAVGKLNDIIKAKGSLTGDYISGRKEIPTPSERRKGSGKEIKILGAQANNLKNINVSIPLEKFVCITGVSGSGKSTLMDDILSKALSVKFHHSRVIPGKHKRITGTDNLDKVISIDQSPIGRTPRSNPATYTGVFTPIRNLFALTPEARMRGYKPGRFSFNVKGGRCEVCRGEGLLRIEMHFLPNVYVTCQECQGKRYNQEALEIHYKGKTIADVLEMTAEEALEFFANIPIVSEKLQVLCDVGLSYIKLGQFATTLSGGEAQRIKLSTELSRKSTGKTLYILDEPTTGLHFDDIKRLLIVLFRLIDKGNTVLVIEHNLDVIKCADHIIDLGPEGGEAGGYIIAEGAPEKVVSIKKSYTGQFLEKILGAKNGRKKTKAN
ncbi:MAG: excinuclease ABC subunit UvrA [Candidatus Berkelbacteria bacterium]|nr:excinuclease ABC subunit UvrA [Candidatus Berkelbacteria bacterium]